MAADQMIPPPPGFVIDPAQSLPPGFVLDSGAPASEKAPSWYDKARAMFTGEKAVAPANPSVTQDIIQSIPGAGARASAGLAGVADMAYNMNKGPEHGPSTLPGPLSAIENFISPPNRKDSNLGGMSLSGLKSLMGSTYQEPQTTPGKIADFALQNVIFGAKKPKDLANIPQTLKNLVAGTTAGAAGELIPDDMPKLKMAAQMIGGFSPSLVEAAMKSPDRATKNAAAMVKQAMKGKTDAEWKTADELLAKSQAQGIPLAGPEAFPGGSQIQQLASDVAASPAAGGKVRDFTRGRADQVQASVGQHLARLGENVGGQEAANQVQSAADKVISKAQDFRSKAASPDYKFQRASDSEALSLMDQMLKTQGDISAGTKWKNDAVQQSGKWAQFSNEMGIKARPWNELKDAGGFAGRNAGKDVSDFNKSREFMQRSKQGSEASFDATMMAKTRQREIDQWSKDMEAQSDKLAQKNLPAIKGKVESFLSNLDNDIRLANPNTTEGKILSAYRNEIAPNGEALVLPSQLESVYKTNRDKLDLGLQPTAMERSTAGVLKSHVKRLDSLIQDVSPAIKQGREIYADMSKTLVDPLFKGPIGKLAGKGVDAQREAPYARMISELQSDTATPKRIGEIADKLKSTGKEAFPNMTRAYLEERLNSSLKDLQGRRNPASGANFRNLVEGTPKDKANLQVMIEKTAEAQGQDPKQVYSGFRNLLDVLDATGRVPGMGSQTQSRMENAAAARANPISGAVEAVSTAPTKRIAKWLDDLMYKGTYSKLAEVFTSPNSIKEMKALANLKPTTPEAQQLASLILTSAAQSADEDKAGEDKTKR